MLRIASGCATREAFISVFRRFCDRESIFIATRTPKEAGSDLQFSITLADGAPLIGGTGTVLDSWTDETSPYGRAGMRIRFDDVSPAGRALIDELVAARKADEQTRPAVPLSGAAAALAALAKVGPPPATPPPRPTTPVKPLPSVIPKPPVHQKTMLGMTPLVRPAKLEATPAPVIVPQVVQAAQVARDVEMKLPPPPRPGRLTPDADDSDEQPTGVAAKFTPDTAFPDEASWDEAANHVLGSTRAKGSDLVLPANPLGGVESESLDAFVECTLYEETGSFAVDVEATTPGGPAVDDWQQDDLTIPPWLQGPVADSPFAADSMAVPPPLLPLSSHSSGPVGGEADARPSEKQAPIQQQLIKAGKAFDPARVTATQPAIPILRSRRNHWPLTIVIAAATGLAGVAIGMFALGRGEGDEPAASDPAAPRVASADQPAAGRTPGASGAPVAGGEKAAQAAATAEPPADPIAQPDSPAAAGTKAGSAENPENADDADKSDEAAAGAGADEADEAPAGGADDKRDEHPAAAAGAPVEFSRLSGKLGKDRCGVEIASRPDKADVYIGSTRIGTTPLKVVLSCGEHALELRRPRYQGASKSIALDPGKLDKLDVNLSRPEHRLRITSVPAGAAVKVNGRSAGTTPATVTVNGFETARVNLELSGYRSWSTRLYVRESTTSVSAKLAAGKSSAKSPGSPAARGSKTSGSRAADSSPRRGN